MPFTQDEQLYIDALQHQIDQLVQHVGLKIDNSKQEEAIQNTTDMVQAGETQKLIEVAQLEVAEKYKPLLDAASEKKDYDLRKELIEQQTQEADQVAQAILDGK